MATKADELFKGLSSPEQKTLQRVFLRIVRPSENGLDTRRRAAFSELPPEGAELVVKLAKERLLVTNQSASDREQTAEVAYEALISNWSTLRAWVNEDREFLLWRERLAELRRRAIAAAGAAALAVILLIISFMMWHASVSARAAAEEQARIADAQRSAAEEQTQIAESRRLAAESSSALAKYPQRSLLHAAAAPGTAPHTRSPWWHPAPPATLAAPRFRIPGRPGDMQGVDQPGERAVHRLGQAEAARRLQRHETVQGGTQHPHGVDHVVALDAIALQHAGDQAHRGRARRVVLLVAGRPGRARSQRNGPDDAVA